MNLPLALITLFQILGTIISVYSLLLVVRIIMTWFSQSPNRENPISFGRLESILERITEPYLALFRRMSWVRVQNLDLSPLVGLLVLQVVSITFLEFARRGRIALGIFLGVSIEAFLGTLSFLLFIVIILGALRIIAFYLKTSSLKMFWYSLDRLFQPLITPILAKLFPRRILPYGTALMLFTTVLIIAAVLCRLIIAFLVPLLMNLPF
ncbi:YggT family protein [Spirochaeta lutea]|uniref:YggT family protein n=1 Tax=Spirochaeta lutea TaxID=1480694 RepID=A0A098QUS6_9SPIO|nr:YggT family protein [Spirochaeta lutea]KGE71464.1 hypothetical protein DC28_11870 [Spirochaeta lutea]